MTINTTLAASTALAALIVCGVSQAWATAPTGGTATSGPLVHRIQFAPADPIEEVAPLDGSFRLIAPGQTLEAGGSVRSQPEGYVTALDQDGTFSIAEESTGEIVYSAELFGLTRNLGVTRLVMGEEGYFEGFSASGEVSVNDLRRDRNGGRAGSELRFLQDGSYGRGPIEYYYASTDESLGELDFAGKVDMTACGPAQGGGGGYGRGYVPYNSHGDVHVFTPDGLKYDWQETGEFVMVRSVRDEMVEIQTRQSPVPTKAGVSMNTAAAMRVGADVLEFYVEAGQRLFYVNGRAQELPGGRIALPGGGSLEPIASGSRRGEDYLVTWPDGFRSQLSFYGSSIGAFMNIGAISAQARAAGSYEYEGLIGNLDGNPKNDLLPRGATRLTCPAPTPTELIEFGDSWRVSAEESLFQSRARLREERMVSERTQREVSVERVVVRLLRLLIQERSQNTTVAVNYGIDASSGGLTVEQFVSRIRESYKVDQQTIVNVMRRVLKREELSISTRLEITEIRQVLRTRIDAAARIQTLDLRAKASAQRACTEGGVTDPAMLLSCILDVGVTGDVAFVESAVAVQESVREISTSLIATRAEQVQQVLTSVALTDQQIEQVLPTGTTVAAGQFASFTQAGTSWVGTVEGLGVTVTAEGIDIVRAEDRTVGPALALVRGTSTTSRVTLAFDRPVYRLELRMGDYDLMGESGEHITNFSVPPSSVTGTLVQVSPGEVRGGQSNGYGSLVWDDLGGVTSISFDHNRTAVSLGVFLVGMTAVAGQEEARAPSYPAAGEMRIVMPIGEITPPAAAGCAGRTGVITAVAPSAGAEWLTLDRLDSNDGVFEMSGSTARVSLTGQRDPSQARIVGMFAGGECQALTLPVTVEYAGSTYEASFDFDSTLAFEAQAETRGVSIVDGFSVQSGIEGNLALLPEVFVDVTVADVIERAIANGDVR